MTFLGLSWGVQLLRPRWNDSRDTDVVSQGGSWFQLLRVCGENEPKNTGRVTHTCCTLSVLLLSSGHPAVAWCQPCWCWLFVQCVWHVGTQFKGSVAVCLYRGSAIAKIIGNNTKGSSIFEEKVRMWMYEEKVEGRNLTEIVNTEHENVKYLPGVKLPTNVASAFFSSCVVVMMMMMTMVKMVSVCTLHMHPTPSLVLYTYIWVHELCYLIFWSVSVFFLSNTWFGLGGRFFFFFNL